MKRADKHETVPVRVRGIPARAVITFYYGGDEGAPDCPPSADEVEWFLTDRQGYYPAPWLERMLDDETERRVHAQVIAGVHAQQREAEEAAAESRYDAMRLE